MTLVEGRSCVPTRRVALRGRGEGGWRAGFTLIEVMAATAIMATGLLGIMAMQGAAVTANRRANEVTMATNLARRWQDRLRRDSYQWNYPNASNSLTNLGNTWYLRLLVGSPATLWTVPVQPAGLAAYFESAAFDYWGNDVTLASTSAHYCTAIRLTTLVVNELVRAEVRVWWYREGGVQPAAYASCGSGGAVSTMGTDITNVHWVYMAQTLERHDL